MASAVREICNGDPGMTGRAMGIIQSAIVGYFETYHITRFVMYAMTTGNWSTQSARSPGNMVAQAVAVKTGIIQQITSMNQLSIQAMRCRHDGWR